MNVASFIAGRVAFKSQKSFSAFIIKLATAATALSVAAMIITLAFVNGFQQAVSNKIFNFWGHIRVQQYEPAKALVAEESPLENNDTVTNIIRHMPGVKKVQAFATKSAVLEKNKEIEGVLVKAVDSSYDAANFTPFITEGKWLNFNDSLYSRDIVISKPVAEELRLHVGDTITVYFISPSERKSTFRKLRVSGIFKSGVEEFDRLFAIADLRLIRRINGWQENEIGGYEIFLNNYQLIDTVNNTLYYQLPDMWVSRSIKELYPYIFDWLNILDVNRNVIFTIMAIVAIINLITCLLILVLERTRMIGVLKAVGGDDWIIQKIFLYHSALIAGRGILIGLAVGLGICFLQQATGFIKLDEAAYYVRTAPVEIVWWQVALVCIASMVVCTASLLLPTLFVRNIQPVKAIQFR
ncbi:ABC transporter permease [Foetidibacter luteolus]|uniref:ABC transporter permease n=1 Tax=Foetidibacter luteolus TaxID=2608880 RepID=UPI00129AFFFC|nr:ABC transporter permease [Foetidibacter luteolus]